MKIRNGFVSNSSSSSFIVFTKSDELDKGNVDKFLSYCKKDRYPWSEEDHMEITIPLGNGNIDFSGSFEEYTSFEDRINYIAENIIYRMYSDGAFDKGYQRMEETLCKALNDVVKEHGIKYLYVNYDYNLAFKGTVGHSDMNRWVEEAFNSPKAMKNFLFGKDSKVEDGNDYYTGPGEEDCPTEYEEGYRFMKKNEKWFKKNLFLSDEENREYAKSLINKLKMDKFIIETQIKALEEANKE